MTEQQAPPGWYAADEPGTLRWWDGSDWSEHFTPDPHAHLGAGSRRPRRIVGLSFESLSFTTNTVAMVATLAGSTAAVMLAVGYTASGAVPSLGPGPLLTLVLLFVAIVLLVDARVGFARRRAGDDTAVPAPPHHVGAQWGQWSPRWEVAIGSLLSVLALVSVLALYSSHGGGAVAITGIFALAGALGFFAVVFFIGAFNRLIDEATEPN